MITETILGERSIVMSEIMTPNMTNFSGNIHGGDLMRFFDKVAYACAVQYASLPMVTLSVDHIFFKEPIHVADLVICKATVNYVGNTSMEIGIRVEAVNLMKKERRHTNTCYFTMVAIDDSGKPISIPTFKPETDEEKARFKAAEERRAQRMEHYKKQQG